MADTQHPVIPSSSEEAGYELSDSGLIAAAFFSGLLAVLLVTSIFATIILLNYFQAQSLSTQDKIHSVVDTQQLPLGVRLQVNPARDWLELKADHEKTLHNYDNDISKLSIEEAIDIISDQGLPSRKE